MPNSGTFVIPSAFTAIDKFSGPVKAMGNTLQGFVGRSERLLGRANIAFSKLMTPITNLNRALMGVGFYVGIYTLIRALKGALNIYADFEQANVDLAIVMGTTVKENRILAAEARRIGLAYGQSATEVVRMQHALATLGFEREQILAMGVPLITGASALEGADLERLADTVGAVINAFESLTAADTQHILDVMSQAGNRTALTFEKMATILPIVSAPANAIGVDFERLVALMGVLSNAGIHVATSATSLKNIFIDTKKAGGKGYIAFLENVIKHVDKLTFANKKVGKRSVVSALALAMKMDPNDKNSFMRLTDEFKALELGLTQKIALQRLDTFRGSMKLLNAAYSEFILSIEDGNGALAQSLIRMTRVATAMLLLSSDSDQAREALEKMDIDIIHSAEKWLGWLKVIGYVTAAIIALKVALIVWRAVVMAATIVQTAWSIAMGIAAANGWLNVMALRGNAVALGTLRTVTWLATAAQTAFNAAVKVNPIYLITIGILGLAEAYGRLTGKIESSVEAHKRFAAERNREYIENKISPGDKLLSMFGFKDLITGREGDYLPGTPEFERQNKVDSIAKINPKAAYDTKLMDSLVNQVFKGKIEMNINDPNNNVKDVKSDSSWLQPKVSSTNGWSN